MGGWVGGDLNGCVSGWVGGDLDGCVSGWVGGDLDGQSRVVDMWLLLDIKVGGSDFTFTNEQVNVFVEWAARPAVGGMDEFVC